MISAIFLLHVHLVGWAEAIASLPAFTVVAEREDSMLVHITEDRYAFVSLDTEESLGQLDSLLPHGGEFGCTFESFGEVLVTHITRK